MAQPQLPEESQQDAAQLLQCLGSNSAPSHPVLYFLQLPLEDA